jgi:hypothetical protein
VGTINDGREGLDDLAVVRLAEDRAILATVTAERDELAAAVAAERDEGTEARQISLCTPALKKDHECTDHIKVTSDSAVGDVGAGHEPCGRWSDEVPTLAARPFAAAVPSTDSVLGL